MDNEKGKELNISKVVNEKDKEKEEKRKKLFKDWSYFQITGKALLILVISGICAQGSVVDKAKDDLGVKEGSLRADQMAQGAGLETSVGRKNAWCAAGVSFWLRQAGYKIEPTASVESLRDELKRAGWQRISSPVPGAVAFFTWSHVGIVKQVVTTKGGRFVVTIEPNTSNQVRELTHYPSKIKEYYIPPQKT